MPSDVISLLMSCSPCLRAGICPHVKWDTHCITRAVLVTLCHWSMIATPHNMNATSVPPGEWNKSSLYHVSLHYDHGRVHVCPDHSFFSVFLCYTNTINSICRFTPAKSTKQSKSAHTDAVHGISTPHCQLLTGHNSCTEQPTTVTITSPSTNSASVGKWAKCRWRISRSTVTTIQPWLQTGCQHASS